MQINDDKLDKWFKNRRNVLFIGKAGVGKTAQIKSCFERNGLELNKTFLYFSTSTLDPWVDLIGVPKETRDENGNTFLELVRPKSLASGKVEAIFFDEFNRSPKKVRNAVMELLQFKSINGLVFPNLKVIWAAINPDDDDTYDVEKLDPAQKDRFHIHAQIPYKPNREWFVKRFEPEIGMAGIEWWDGLPDEEKDKVSPRRLEYALEEYASGGHPEDILPKSSNISKLMMALRNGPIDIKLRDLMKSGDVASAKLFIANDNNYNSSIKYIIEKSDIMEFFVPLIPKEKLVTLMSENDKISRFVFNKHKENDEFKQIMRDILSAGSNTKLVKKIRRAFNENSSSVENINEIPLEKAEQSFFHNKSSVDLDTSNTIKTLHSSMSATEYNNPSKRESVFNKLKSVFSNDMSDKDASLALDIVCMFVNCSWASTIVQPKFDKLAGMINYCLHVLNRNKPQGSKSIIEELIKRSSEYSNMFAKLAQSEIYKKIVRV